MDTQLITDILADICSSVGLPQPSRDPVRVWSLSGVERIAFPDGTTAIYKFAAEPFTSEDRILHAAGKAAVPVPAVIGAIVRDDVLGMVIEDLGEPVRDAVDADGIVAAVALHDAAPASMLLVLDDDALTALPALARGHLRRLRDKGRWTEGTDDIVGMLDALTDAAAKRADGATTAPWGWVHSEFHPTSLHIGRDGWRLLDFARAFNGPGLIDLASWHGTIEDADPVRLRRFIQAYVTAGGHPSALAERGGLAPEAWALGWHRVWAVEWFMEQALRWINDPSQDEAYITVVRRHLKTAVRLLEP
ncbi:phosphotransferase family protein [Streptomyces sp. H39-S7]|uniref:phosphotransferase family protein n=1 Tax=Streptomyces sp. H39-S7 TaxID=3004357 RepID=UPI0022AFDA45|nr:phosphotransferase [Streptomyces sp. H39-S7]MCZ4120210.1 phosphotransferase [Streptomyces sp. H39-S7]